MTSTGRPLRRPHGNQGGYTLPEVILAAGLATFIAAALTSVVFVASSANTTWNPRLQASGQIRGFQQSFTDDVAMAGMPSFASAPCPGVSPAPAPSAPIVLRGVTFNPSPSPTLAPIQAAYWYDRTNKVVVRCSGGNGPAVVARYVTAFQPILDRTGNTIIITITAQDAGSGQYSQTQTMRFYPRRDSP